VEIDHSPVYELLLRLFVAGDEDCLEFEMGEQLASALEGASTTLRKDIAAVGAASEVWIALIALAYEHGAADVGSFIDHVAGLDAVALRSKLIDCCWIEPKDRLSSADMEAAARGDMEAVKVLAESVLVKNKHEGLRYLLAMEPERTKSTIVEILRRYAAEVFTDAVDVAEVLARDAAEKAALAEHLPADQAIEIATNGITVDVGVDTTGVILIPAMAARPWVIITETGTRKILCYGATADIVEDPDAPPAWVVKFYKALGDEKRLRILGVLREGPSNLGDLAQRLELSKSTIHHHVGMLRAAGLVRVTLGRDKEYSLRTDAVPQAGQLLEAYLAPTGGTS
jgi:DNA-binding transcriptional ArsR family regulator